MGDVTKFDTTKFKEAMASASSVSADKIEIGKVEYKTKVSYSLAEAVTELAAKEAIASSCGVPESRVEYTFSWRRLSERIRLATSIDAIISTQTASEVSGIATNAANATKLKQAFTDLGLTVTPSVARQPKNSVVVKTMLKGEAGAAAPEVPAPEAIHRSVSDKVGTTVVATILNIDNESQTNTPAPSSASGETSRKAPSLSAELRSWQQESSHDAKGQTPSALLASATATLAAIVLDAV